MTSNSELFEFDENQIPSNTLYGDTYYSKMGGLDETYEVFINATKIDQKLKSQNHVVIGETGFGTGLNFLAVLKEFEKAANPNSHLSFYTFEKHLMGPEFAARAHAKFPEISAQSQKLLKNWPPAIKGLHSIEICTNVFLNIFIGDANETMGLCNFKADAWFLDGFAPAKNPDFWNDEIFAQIARLIKPDGLIATYSVAAIVREGLSRAGFEYEKLTGFGNKKHRLVARPPSTFAPPNPNIDEIIIVGGGIAGLSLAHYAKKFDIKPIVFDNDLDGNFKASNNPRGICMPRLDRLDNTEARFFKTAYLHALRFYRNIDAGFAPSKIKEPAKNQRDIEKFQKFKNQPPLTDDFVEIHDEFLLHNAALIEPPIVCEKLREDIKIKPDKVKKIQKSENSWVVLDEYNQILARAKTIIIAAGAQTNSLIGNQFPLSGREGVVSIADYQWPLNEIPIASGGYAIPFKNQTLFGATFERTSLEKTPEILENSHTKNIETIAKFAPELSQNLAKSIISGRASMRVVSKDKLPIAGVIDEGLYVLGALGSRGFSMAPYLAQMIITQIATTNLTIEKGIAELLKPNRFGNLFSSF